jgi:hypothetical protein
MGTGKYLDNPISTDGVSWVWQNYANGLAWPTNVLSLPPYVTGSWQNSNPGGTVWYYSA